MNLIRIAGVLAAAACLAVSGRADAFCGFYVNGAGNELYNNATQVVLMRDGTTTVVSMQNNYQGPPESFALVVPVPVVLHKPDVKTLPREVFDKVDTLAAPRLVEYWEQDPCAQPRYGTIGYGSGTGSGYGIGAGRGGMKRKHGVKIEAQFEVGEYQIVILSATESTGLETWLNEEGYKIPKGAAAYLKPYVEQGSKFFVAKVDVTKVTMKDGMAQLSPLRFHYPSDDLRLPIRLGLMNAHDKQDLIVHVLALQTRYQLANYANVFIPTNLDVKDATRERFGEFYAALFDATVEKNPGAAVTEYAWDSGSCDPCPTPALTARELTTLGLDVLGKAPEASVRRPPRGWVLTRLHMRYGPGDAKDDLVFEKADAVMGGREMRSGPDRTLEEGAVPGRRNNFQARYAIRHPWTGPIACDQPVRGRWGGPPAGEEKAATRAARDLAFAPRGKTGLGTFVSATSIPGIGAVTAAPPAPVAPPPTETPPSPAPEPKKSEKSKGCAVSGDRGTPSGVAIWVALAALAAGRRRRRS